MPASSSCSSRWSPTTGLTFALGITDPATPLYYPTRFLVWNLILAWIPVFFAVWFATVGRRIWLVPLGLGWLAFLPNAPYLVTDLIHLGEGVELWRHVLQYGFAAWTGILLGVVSMRLVHDACRAASSVRSPGGRPSSPRSGCARSGSSSGASSGGTPGIWSHRPDAVMAKTLEWVLSPVRLCPVDGRGRRGRRVLRARLPDDLGTRRAGPLRQEFAKAGRASLRP